MADKILYLTSSGLANLERELNFLQTVRPKEVANRIYDALQETGDFDDNAAYVAVKLEQSFVEGRIKAIERTLARALESRQPLPLMSPISGVRYSSKRKMGSPKIT